MMLDFVPLLGIVGEIHQRIAIINLYVKYPEHGET